MDHHPHKITFTIITVSYNCRTLIEKTIESVLQQDFPAKEYILIDGGSTDGTAEIIKKHAKHLAFWCSEPDGGIYQGMNKGLSHAQGEWILFLNAGDVFSANDVLTKVFPFTRNKEDEIIYGDIFTFKNNEKIVKKALEPCNKQRMFFCHQAVFVRTVLMKEHPFDTRFKMSADFYFFKFCYLTNRKFRHIPVIVSIYDRTGISNTRRIEGLKENIRVIQELDKGWNKIKFLCKLYFVIGWNKIRTSIKRNKACI